MSLKLSLQVVLVVEDDSLVRHRDEYLFAVFVSEVMHSVVYVVV